MKHHLNWDHISISRVEIMDDTQSVLHWILTRDCVITIACLLLLQGSSIIAVFWGKGIPIIKIRWPWNLHIFIYGESYTGKMTSYIKTVRWLLIHSSAWIAQFHSVSYPIDFGLIIPHVDVGMHESLVYRDPLLRVYHQHLGQEITCHAGLQAAVLRRVGGE